jgi:hypothetical protein
MYRISIIALPILLCTVGLMGCHSGNGEMVSPDKNVETFVNGIENVVVHSDYSKAVSFKEIPSKLQGQSGHGLGFVRVEDRDIDPFDRPQTEEFRLIASNTFAPFLVLVNGDQESKTFLITTILDYQQVRFELDEMEGLLHEITVPPETDMELPFTVNVEGKGTHDIQVVAFDYPYNRTLDEDFRMNLYGHIASRRATIIIGEDETPVRSLQPTITGIPAAPDVTFKPYICFASAVNTEETHASERQLYVDEALNGELYQFQILLNSRNNKPATYVMIPFLDFHQVEINGQDIIIAYLESKQEATINVEVTLPEEPGIHQFQIIWLLDPYLSILREEVLTPFVFGSPRIAIVTR